jgi:hypothetical protein
MQPGRTVFAQLMSYVSPRKFRTCVDRYGGDYKTSRFVCWDQFLCMAFAQLTYRESLRDIEACLRAVQPKLYHMGIRARVARSTLADANETCDWRIYRGLCQRAYRYRSRVVPQRTAGGRSISRMPSTPSTPQSSSCASRSFRGPTIVGATAGSSYTLNWICEAQSHPWCNLPTQNSATSRSFGIDCRRGRIDVGPSGRCRA